MINGVGKNGLGRVDLQRAQVARGEAPAKAEETASQAAGASPSGLISDLASGPPVDAEKIAALRAAIAEGRYPVDPDKIAERMLALDLPLRDEG
jgi:negative regulator of flagellin synthesis FlgM